jgi:hypothetical protein
MGPLDQIIGNRGGHEPAERLAREQANFDDPRSPVFEHWNQLVWAAPPEDEEIDFDAGDHTGLTHMACRGVDHLVQPEVGLFPST